MHQRASRPPSWLSASALVATAGVVMALTGTRCTPAKDKALQEGPPVVPSGTAPEEPPHATPRIQETRGHHAATRGAGDPCANDAGGPCANDAGGPHRKANAPACAPEMANLGTYCIDRYEAHLVTVTPSGREAPHPHTERPPSGAPYRAGSALGVFPQGYINRVEAAAACRAAGKRLCSLREWHDACTGRRRHVYPYGPEKRAGTCNTGKLHLLSILFGRDPGIWSYDLHFNSPKLNAEPGYLARSGEYSGCMTELGVYDLVGNLHEWVSDVVDATLESKVPLSDPLRRSLRRNRGHGVFMGGFYSTSSQHGEGCNYLTPGHEPGYHDYSTGFRCCKDLAGAVR